MTIQRIQVGTYPNDGTGDTLRQSFSKVNDNFLEIDKDLRDQANVSNTINIVAQRSTNVIFRHANSAFDQANSAFFYATAVDDNMAYAHLKANLAFQAANGTVANTKAAFNQANLAYNFANTLSIQINDTANGLRAKDNVIFNFANTLNVAINDAKNGLSVRCNLIYNFANSVHFKVNTNFALTNCAYNTANVAFHTANGAFDWANTVGATVLQQVIPLINAGLARISPIANGAYFNSNAAFGVANSAYRVANSAFTNSNAAFTKANTAFANTSGTFGGILTVAPGPSQYLLLQDNPASDTVLYGSNLLSGYNFAADGAEYHINYRGYHDSTTYFRNTGIYDGKQNLITYFHGPSKSLYSYGDIVAYYSSDIRLKENIEPIVSALDKVVSVSGVTFDWKADRIQALGGEDDYMVRRHDVGVIAQEIQAVLPEAVATREDGTMAVRYEKLVPLLIEAIKDLKKEIDDIKGNR